ncbi:hypothetical protein M432DRAFT_676645 [Thermoascus aurantiacus ATCC 26904]
MQSITGHYFFFPRLRLACRLKMEVLAALGAWALGTFCASLPAGSYGIASNICGRGDITTELGPKLSNGAHIYFPGSTRFGEGTNRWSSGSCSRGVARRNCTRTSTTPSERRSRGIGTGTSSGGWTN